MAVSGNDGRLYLLDGTSLGAHKDAALRDPEYSNAGATSGDLGERRHALDPGAPQAARSPGLELAANGPVTGGSRRVQARR